MVDENYFRKLRNLVSTCPKPDYSWGEFASGDKTMPAADNSYEATRRLVADFLNLVSGGNVAAMLDDVLSPREKEDLPALGNRGELNHLMNTKCPAGRKELHFFGFQGTTTAVSG